MADFPGFRSLKANFTTVPNQYFDRIVGHYHPCVERVVGILIRSTLGWEDPDTGERRLEAELSLSDFERPELSESSARRGIAGAIEAGFIIQTMEATSREPARYALRWEDPEAHKAAIVRQRKAHGVRKRKGSAVAAPAWKRRQSDPAKNQRCHGERCHRDTSHRDTSLYNKDSERNSDPKKKEKKENDLPSASKKEGVQPTHLYLSRARRRLVKEGKAVTQDAIETLARELEKGDQK